MSGLVPIEAQITSELVMPLYSVEFSLLVPWLFCNPASMPDNTDPIDFGQ